MAYVHCCYQNLAAQSRRCGRYQSKLAACTKPHQEDRRRRSGVRQRLPGVLRHVGQHRCYGRYQPAQQRRQHRLARPAGFRVRVRVTTAAYANGDAQMYAEVPVSMSAACRSRHGCAEVDCRSVQVLTRDTSTVWHAMQRQVWREAKAQCGVSSQKQLMCSVAGAAGCMPHPQRFRQGLGSG